MLIAIRTVAAEHSANVFTGEINAEAEISSVQGGTIHELENMSYAYKLDVEENSNITINFTNGGSSSTTNKKVIYAWLFKQ